MLNLGVTDLTSSYIKNTAIAGIFEVEGVANLGLILKQEIWVRD